MYKIVNKNLVKDVKAKLKNDELLFHNAHINGCGDYLVENKNGDDFYISYSDDEHIVPSIYKEAYKKVNIDRVLPLYDEYNENDLEKLSFEVFKNKRYVVFDEANEYSIVLAKLLLNRNIKVYFNDERIKWFIDSIDINEKCPDMGKACFVSDNKIFISANEDELSYEMAFHNVFYMQDLIKKSLSNIKYVKIKISSINGIGIIPIYLKKLNNLFSKYNLKVVLDPSGIRYSKEFLKKVFSYDFEPLDLVDENTVYISDISRIMLTYEYIKSDESYGYEIFNKIFREELDNFAFKIINSKKVLGLLIRGTDYISTNIMGENRMAPIDVLLPMIKEWVEIYSFDSLFLATEDQDVLDKLKIEFGDKLYYVEQKRFKASEFDKGETIAEREKKKYSKEEYQKNVDDTTEKYLTALYTLSLCDSLICSGMCNGYQVVKALNANRFSKEYLHNIKK